MRFLITTLLLCGSFLSAQETKDSLQQELNNISIRITELYRAKDYTHIDSLNLRRDALIDQLSSQGYEPQGKDLLIEMDYIIARLSRVSSQNNPVVIRLKRKKAELVRDLKEDENKN